MIVPFILLTGLRSWTQSNMITFLPKYYNDLGYRPSVYGVITALFMGGSAVGGVIGGWLADRFSKRKIAMSTLFAAVLPLGLFPILGDTGWVYFILPLAGVLTGASHSIIVVLAQRMSPRRMGMASGMVLGLTFVSGAFGTFLSGFQADLMGLEAMFYTTAGIAFLASILTVRLPEA
jgi:FSR family fosmidomycin resistance protein-like MFS transporter